MSARWSSSVRGGSAILNRHPSSITLPKNALRPANAARDRVRQMGLGPHDPRRIAPCLAQPDSNSRPLFGRPTLLCLQALDLFVGAVGRGQIHVLRPHARAGKTEGICGQRSPSDGQAAGGRIRLMAQSDLLLAVLSVIAHHDRRPFASAPPRQGPRN